jgi:prophage regulatory protein
MSDGATRSRVIALRLPAVCRMTGLGRSTIYRMQAEQRFPQGIKLGVRAVGWVEREVQEWLTNRIESSRSRRG